MVTKSLTRVGFFEETDVSNAKPLKMEADRGTGGFSANAATYQSNYKMSNSLILFARKALLPSLFGLFNLIPPSVDQILEG